MKHRLFLYVFFILNIPVCLAQDWRSIKPLHSTRTDVIKLLGKPPSFNEPIWMSVIYPIPEGRLNILYARRPCEQDLQGDLGNWNVEPETVLNMTVFVTKRLKVSKLKIPNLYKYKWYSDDSGTAYYRLKDKGIQYQIQNKLVTAITYGPTEKDKELFCGKDAPENQLQFLVK